MKKISQIWLALIIGLTIILRFSYTTLSPPALNWDEASLGFNAFSILKTGKDEWGRVLPLSFEAFGDYKLPGYIYASIPFIATFGLNEDSVRFPSRVAGVISIVLLYLVVKKLTSRESLALLSASLLAISPTAIFLSRAALEANLAFAIFLAGFYFFLRGLEKPVFLFFSSFLFGLTLFTYNSSRVFIPIILVGLIFFYRRRLKELKGQLIVPGLILAVFFLIAYYFAIFQDSSARFYWVTILDQGAINFLNETRAHSKLPFYLSELTYNRFTYFGWQFVLNFFKNLSPDFLFINGGSNHQFSVLSTGFMYIIELPLLILGLLYVFKNKLLRNIILLWTLAAVIPSAITREAPHVLRSIFMLGALQILAAFGLYQLIEKIKERGVFYKRFLVFLTVTVYILSIAAYCYQYFLIYPKMESASWQYGMRQVYQYLSTFRDKQIYITKKYGEPHIFYLFFNQYDPSRYQENLTLVRYAQTNWRWVDRIDNIYFINDWEIKDKLVEKSNAILVTSPGNFPEESKYLKSIYFLDGRKAFDVVEL